MNKPHQLFDLIEGEVQPLQVSRMTHKQPAQSLSKALPVTQHVVVESQSCAGGGRDLEIHSISGVVCCQLILQN